MDRVVVGCRRRRFPVPPLVGRPVAEAYPARGERAWGLGRVGRRVTHRCSPDAWHDSVGPASAPPASGGARPESAVQWCKTAGRARVKVGELSGEFSCLEIHASQSHERGTATTAHGIRAGYGRTSDGTSCSTWGAGTQGLAPVGKLSGSRRRRCRCVPEEGVRRTR